MIWSITFNRYPSYEMHPLQYSGDTFCRTSHVSDFWFHKILDSLVWKHLWSRLQSLYWFLSGYTGRIYTILYHTTRLQSSKKGHRVISCIILTQGDWIGRSFHSPTSITTLRKSRFHYWFDIVHIVTYIRCIPRYVFLKWYVGSVWITLAALLI